MKLLMCLYGLYFMHSIASHSSASKNLFNLQPGHYRQSSALQEAAGINDEW